MPYVQFGRVRALNPLARRALALLPAAGWSALYSLRPPRAAIPIDQQGPNGSLFVIALLSFAWY